MHVYVGGGMQVLHTHVPRLAGRMPASHILLPPRYNISTVVTAIIFSGNPFTEHLQLDYGHELIYGIIFNLPASKLSVHACTVIPGPYYLCQFGELIPGLALRQIHTVLWLSHQNEKPRQQ